MRIFLCWLLLLGFVLDAEAQKNFITSDGEIKFASKAQLEMIKASSNKLHGIIDPATNKFAFLVSIPSFQGFNSELQRKHFNENYLESDKFAMAKFSGKII